MPVIDEFLRRIGLAADTPAEPTYEFLKAVQYHSVLRIAYANLDILEGKPLCLSPDALFDKIVTRGRGGYCFEVNGLLSYFFKSCGFEVKDYFARYLRGEPEIPDSEFDAMFDRYGELADALEQEHAQGWLVQSAENDGDDYVITFEREKK